MDLLGLDMVGADEGGLIGAATDTLKKAGAALVPAAASLAEDALSDKPKDGKPKDGSKGSSGGSSDESFLTKPMWAGGPVKWWHAIVGVVAGGGGLYLWKRK